LQRVVDQHQHALHVAIDLIVPEPQDSETLLRKMTVTFGIASRVTIEIVLAPVDLDDEAMLQADKVDDEIVAGRLPAEVIAAFLPRS
jgi:hypothetical protein